MIHKCARRIIEYGFLKRTYEFGSAVSAVFFVQHAIIVGSSNLIFKCMCFSYAFCIRIFHTHFCIRIFLGTHGCVLVSTSAGVLYPNDDNLFWESTCTIIASARMRSVHYKCRFGSWNAERSFAVSRAAGTLAHFFHTSKLRRQPLSTSRFIYLLLFFYEVRSMYVSFTNYGLTSSRTIRSIVELKLT